MVIVNQYVLNRFGAFLSWNPKQMAEGGNAGASDESLKLAVAISLLRSKFMKNIKDCNAISPSQSDTLLRWKRKVQNYASFFCSINPMPFLFLPYNLRYIVF